MDIILSLQLYNTFAKWVEAIPIKSTKGDKIMDFLVKFIISRYGAPKLFMDNGPNFKGNEVRDFFVEYHIEMKFSSPYYHRGNGQAEASNKVIKSILSKIVVQHGKYWHE